MDCNARFFAASRELEKRAPGKIVMPALGWDVLEAIYYMNAAQLYPRVKAVLEDMGYTSQ